MNGNNEMKVNGNPTLLIYKNIKRPKGFFFSNSK